MPASGRGYSEGVLADKALWFIENHFAGDITLDDVAGAAGVTRFHVSRAFAYATGCSA